MKNNRKFVFHGVIEKEKNQYSALCLELDVASCGKTIEEAKRNLIEAVKLYITDVLEDGEEKEFIPRPVPKSVVEKYEMRFRKCLTEPEEREMYEFGEVVYA